MNMPDEPPSGAATFSPEALARLAQELSTGLPGPGAGASAPAPDAELTPAAAEAAAAAHPVPGGDDFYFLHLAETTPTAAVAAAAPQALDAESLAAAANELYLQPVPGLPQDSASLESDLEAAGSDPQPESPPAHVAPLGVPGFDPLDPEVLGRLAGELYSAVPRLAPDTLAPRSETDALRHAERLPRNEPSDRHLASDLAAPGETVGGPVAPHAGSYESFYFLPDPSPPRSPPAPGWPYPGTPDRAEAFHVESIRRDFPALQQQVHGKPLIWLDNAATTQKPRSVIEALALFYERDNSNVHRAAHTLAARATNAYEGARDKVQRFLGAGSADEIVFVRGTTEAINLVAQSYGRRFVEEGDEILLTHLEHHANIVPWQLLAEEKGAELRVVPIGDRGEVMLDRYERLFTSRTRLVALSHVSNALGTVLPIRAMVETAHRHGARVVVDGAQAVSHLPVDVQELGCDFYAFSGHKLFAPTGVGVLYGRRELLEEMPPWQGGGSMIEDVTFERTTYNEIPFKFEAGTPILAGAVGLGAAIDYVRQIGLERAAEYERELLEYATEALTAIPGLRLIGTAPDKVSVLSFILDGMRAEDVGPLLDEEGIAVRAGHHCAQPTMRRYGLTATVRPALAFYNTKEEIDVLARAVRKIALGATGR